MSRANKGNGIPTRSFTDSANGFKGWVAGIGNRRGIPTPAISGGCAIIGAGYGSYDVWGVDLETGAVAWHRRTTDDGPTAVTISDGYAAYNTESCTLEILRVGTGERVWHRWLGDPLLAQPCIHQGRVYMAWPAQGNHVLGAFELSSGEPLWKAPLGGDIITAPVASGNVLAVSTYDGFVSIFDPGTGELRTRCEHRATSAPWLHGGEIYVAQRAEGTRPRSTADEARGMRRSMQEREMQLRNQARAPTMEYMCKLSLKSGEMMHRSEGKPDEYHDKSWGEEEKKLYKNWDESSGFSSPPPSAKLDQVSNLIGEDSVSRAWRHQGSRPVIHQGMLIDTSGDVLEAKDLESMKMVWESKIGETKMVGERALTPPAAANGRVLLGTWGGEVIQLDSTTGKIRWRVNVGAPVHWQPVMSGGRVLAGLQNGTLVCFETGDPLDDGWAMWGGGPGHNGLDCQAGGDTEARDETSNPAEEENAVRGGKVSV